MPDVNAATWRDYERDLLQERKSAHTIAGYRQAFVSLAQTMTNADLLALSKTDVSKWLIGLQATHAPSSQLSYFSRIRSFYRWAEREGLLEGPSPMAGMRAPAQDERLVAIPAAADISAVLAAITAAAKKATGWARFTCLRDEAIIRLWCEPGAPRVSAMAALPLAQIDMNTDILTFADKGRKWRTISMSPRTARAMSRYLRARARQAGAGRPELWLGKRGPMTRDGLYQMAERRCAQAGVPRIHPHAFRHFTTDAWLAAGGRERDIAVLNGWSSTEMLRRYGAAAAGARALAASRELSAAASL